MRAEESKRGVFERGTWGAIVFRNEYGTLETQKTTQGHGTFIGSCIVDGKTATRKMSGEKYEVRDRWEKWQRRTLEQAKEVKMAKQEVSCAQLDALTKAIQDATKELHAIVEGVNEIWLLMADGKAKAQPDALLQVVAEWHQADALADFLKQAVWLDYINLPSGAPYESYCEYAKGKNCLPVDDVAFGKAFMERFADVLTIKDGVIKAVA